jgi:hypothetical protein
MLRADNLTIHLRIHCGSSRLPKSSRAAQSNPPLTFLGYANLNLTKRLKAGVNQLVMAGATMSCLRRCSAAAQTLDDLACEATIREHEPVMAQRKRFAVLPRHLFHHPID